MYSIYNNAIATVGSTGALAVQGSLRIRCQLERSIMWMYTVFILTCINSKRGFFTKISFDIQA